jgi:VanZ family protein
MTCPSGPRPPSRWLDGLLLALLVGVLSSTLLPGADSDPSASGAFFSRAWGWPDAIRNLLLLAPLGLGLGFRGPMRGRVLMFALALPLMIELAQLAIPGRAARASDAVLNSAGMLAAGWVGRYAQWWAAPTRRVALYLTCSSAVFVLAMLVATSGLLTRATPSAHLDPAWTPDLPWFGRYDGRVVSASVGKQAILPRAPAPGSQALAEALDRNDAVTVEFEVGRPPATTSPLVRVNDARYEVLLVAIDRDDLLVHLHARGDTLGFQLPFLRFENVLHGVPIGERVALTFNLVGTSHGHLAGARAPQMDLELRARGGEQQVRAGYAAGAAWRLIAYGSSLGRPAGRWLDAASLGLLFLPLGYWGLRTPEALAVVIAALASLAPVSERLGLLGPNIADGVMIAASLCVGLLASLAIRRPRRHASSS